MPCRKGEKNTFGDYQEADFLRCNPQPSAPPVAKPTPGRAACARRALADASLWLFNVIPNCRAAPEQRLMSDVFGLGGYEGQPCVGSPLKKKKKKE